MKKLFAVSLHFVVCLGLFGRNASLAGSLSRRAAVRPLASDYVVVWRSSDTETLYSRTPGLTVCPNGRLAATVEMGGPHWRKEWPSLGKGTGRTMLFTSDNRGKTWKYHMNFPLGYARPFLAGGRLYLLGRQGELAVMVSDDWGETWTEPRKITTKKHWHQSACNVHYAKGNVYLVMERKAHHKEKSWGVADLAPVLLRAKETDDLTDPSAWTFSSELAFCDAVDDTSLQYVGLPFFACYYPRVALAGLRGVSPMGWLETNVVQFVDPDHVWYDDKQRTFHLWMRANTHTTNLAGIAKVVENEDGTMTTLLQKAPSGKTMVFVPCPGGQMRFHILYDDETRLYWLLGSQSTDSMCRPETLSPERYSLPNNERNRLQLHFSKNCMDWCFAGLVAVGASPAHSRHYASMAIQDKDLHILSRSGDEEALNSHDGNLITFHTIKDFRRLVY